MIAIHMLRCSKTSSPWSRGEYNHTTKFRGSSSPGTSSHVSYVPIDWCTKLSLTSYLSNEKDGTLHFCHTSQCWDLISSAQLTKIIVGCVRWDLQILTSLINISPLVVAFWWGESRGLSQNCQEFFRCKPERGTNPIVHKSWRIICPRCLEARIRRFRYIPILPQTAPLTI